MGTRDATPPSSALSQRVLQCCLCLLLSTECNAFASLYASAPRPGLATRLGLGSSAMPRPAGTGHGVFGGVRMRLGDDDPVSLTKPMRKRASVRRMTVGGMEGGSVPPGAQGGRQGNQQGSMASRKQTFLEQAAAADLDQAELELKLASLKGELQAINSKMIATLRRRRKLLKQQSAGSTTIAGAEYSDNTSDGETFDTFTGSIDTFCTAEEYDMDVAFRRLRVWSRGQAKFMESATVVHVRTGSRFTDDEDDPNAERLIEADEGDVFVFPYGVVVCWGLTEEQTEELQTVMRFCERRGYNEPEVHLLKMLHLCDDLLAGSYFCLAAAQQYTETERKRERDT